MRRYIEEGSGAIIPMIYQITSVNASLTLEWRNIDYKNDMLYTKASSPKDMGLPRWHYTQPDKPRSHHHPHSQRDVTSRSKLWPRTLHGPDFHEEAHKRHLALPQRRFRNNSGSSGWISIPARKNIFCLMTNTRKRAIQTTFRVKHKDDERELRNYSTSSQNHRWKTNNEQSLGAKVNLQELWLSITGTLKGQHQKK